MEALYSRLRGISEPAWEDGATNEDEKRENAQHKKVMIYRNTVWLSMGLILFNIAQVILALKALIESYTAQTKVLSVLDFLVGLIIIKVLMKWINDD